MTRARRALAGLAVGVAGVVGVVGVVGVAGGGAAARAATVTTTTAGAPAATSSSNTDAAVRDAIAFVEKTRELKFLRAPKVTVLPVDAFGKRLDRLRKDDPSYASDTAEFRAVLRALGLVSGKGDPEKLLDALLAGGVYGFYDPKSQVLVVRAGSIGPSARATIVHELTHALEDQHFKLDRPALAKAHDDSESAFQFLVEGSARYVENRYRATFTAAEAAQSDAEESSLSNQQELFALVMNADYAKAVPFLLTSLLAPYEDGKTFIAAVVAAKGMAGLNDVYSHPPTTTEQAMDYQRYVAGDGAKKVPTPPVPKGAKVVSSGVMGEATLDALFATPVTLTASSGAISPAAVGWGGDAYVAWQSKSSVCLRMDLVMDTPTDLREVRDALVDFADGRSGASVEDRAGGLRFTSCGARA